MCPPLEPFSRSRVQSILHCGNLRIWHEREIGLLRTVIADEAVGVLVGAAFPRVVCVRGKAPHVGGRFNTFPVAVLRSAVERDGVPGIHRNIFESRRDCFDSVCTRLSRQLGDEYESGLALHERIDSGLVVTRLDGVSLPVSDSGTTFHDCWSLVDTSAEWLCDARESSCPVRDTTLASSAEIHAQIFAAANHRAVAYLRVYELVHGFVRDPLLEVDTNPPCNLFRRPAFLEMPDDI